MNKKINILLLFLIGIGIAQGAQSYNSDPTILERDGDEPQTKKRTRDFTCQHCGKKFNFPFERHIRTHTGEKPFACIVCKLSFIDKSNLIRHKKTQHKELLPLPFDKFLQEISEEKLLLTAEEEAALNRFLPLENGEEHE